MDPALNQNKPELGIPVLPVPLKMLPDGHRLLDQVVAILGQLRSHALALQDAQDLVAGDEPNLNRLLHTTGYSWNPAITRKQLLSNFCQDSCHTKGAALSQEREKNLFNLAHNIPQIVRHTHSLVYRGATSVQFN